VTQNVTNVIIAAAAVIGLVPLGIRAIVQVVKGRRRKKSNELLATVLLSAFASLLAPGMLDAAGRHIAAIRDALPGWVTAAIPEPTAEAPQPSANGSGPADALAPEDVGGVS
jgi:hypothetical protein